MKKILKFSGVVLLLVLILGLIHLFTHVPELSEKNGVVEAKLYLGKAEKQPLFVGII